MTRIDVGNLPLSENEEAVRARFATDYDGRPMEVNEARGGRGGNVPSLR
jgi:hypothetical protein